MAFKSDLSVDQKSDLLKNQRIALGVTGSIAAVETIKLARELRRHGAHVKAYLSKGGAQFVTPLSLEWGTANPVVHELSGSAEHIAECDLVLIAPASFQTINKIAQGMADTPVTTLVQSAWGMNLPIVGVPTMHASLWENPVFQKNMAFLKEQKNFYILDPVWEEGKAKLLSTEEIVARVSHIAHQKSKLAQKKILITAGPTEGPIDRIRFLSNRSTGALGVDLAKALYMKGALPTLIYGPGVTKPPSYVEVINIKTPDQMLSTVLLEAEGISYDAGIFAAAVLDHVPSQVFDKKLSSQDPLQVDFIKTPKIIREVDRIRRFYKIGFKLEWKRSDEEMKWIGYEALETMNAQVVVVNDLSKMSESAHPAWILDRKNILLKVQTKDQIIQELIHKLEDDL